MKLSIIIPVFNEINCIEIFTNNLKNVFINENVEYIFINDGSNDGSEKWLESYIKKQPEENNKFVNLTKNTGKGNALHEGLKICTGDHILFQDSDLELDTKDSLEMYQILKKDNSIKCVFGSRYLAGKLKSNKNYFNEFVGKINSLFFNILFFQSLSDVHCGVKIISREVIKKINLTIKDYGFEIDLASQIAKNNFDIFEYGVSYYARSFKEGKKITWIDGIKTYYYLFKTRFVDNELSIQVSILFSIAYMMYIGSHFSMGAGKLLMILITFIIGLFIGLKRKAASSSLIYLFCYVGSLFSKGNGKIYTVVLGFIIGIYLSKKISALIGKTTKNKFIHFFV